ncbi:MAG: hypothetical protein H7145_12465 [Akkermansiaceae bacterium]|nr:hypothetical protein [Armatimonadota bacterium]
MAKGSARDWAQLDAFEAEYRERLAGEKKRDEKRSQYLEFLRLMASGVDDFFADEVKARDDDTRRLFALRGKIVSLRDKLGESPDPDGVLPAERPYVTKVTPKPKPADPAHPPKVRVFADVLPPNHLYPVTFADVRDTLATLPPEHAAVVREVRLSNQKRTGSDADWLEGEIRLHCVLETIKDAADTVTGGRRLVGRREDSLDTERFGGRFAWDGNKLYALWDLSDYKTFVLKRALIHEVAHGIAELPGYAAQVRSVGSVEKFCEQYAENYYRPAGKSVRLGF